MILATSVAAVATMNRPGSARISMCLGNRRSNSLLRRRARCLERLDVLVVMGGEPAADVEDLDLVVAAAPGLHEDAGRQVQRLDIVLEVGALAADVEADPLDHQPGVERRPDEVDGLAGGGAELARQFDHRPRCWAPCIRRHRPACGACLLDLADLLQVVVGDQRLVLVQFLQRLGGLDGVGVDDLVPDPVLPLPGRQVLDVLVDDQELGHARPRRSWRPSS